MARQVAVDADFLPEQYRFNMYAKGAFARKIFAMLTGVPEGEVQVVPNSLHCWWENSDACHPERIDGRLIYNTVLPYYGTPRDDTAFFQFDWVLLNKTPNKMGVHRNYIIHGVSTEPEVVRTY